MKQVLFTYLFVYLFIYLFIYLLFAQRTHSNDNETRT